MTTIQAKWIRFDEISNAFDYLDKCYTFLKSVEYEPQNWKWVVITLHSALYGFAISACKGTNADSVVTRTKRGQERLIDFNEAIKRVEDPSWMRVNINYQQFKFTPSQKESIRRLQKVFRNNFVHFKPTSWSIEIHGIPLILLDCLEAIRLLIIFSDVSWRLSSSKLRIAKSIIFQSKKLIKNSLLYKESIIIISTTGTSK